MKTPGDRIDTIEKNLGTLMIKALSLKLELSKADFKEEDHPRADDGKFGSGSGSGKKEDTRSSESDGGTSSSKGKITTTLTSKDGTPKSAKIEYGENEMVSKTTDGKNVPIKSISGNKESVTVVTGEMTIPMGRNPDQTISGTMAKYNEGKLEFSRDSYDYSIKLSQESIASINNEVSRLPDKFKPKPATYNKEGLKFHEGLRE
jgi:hypothetical protein